MALQAALEIRNVSMALFPAENSAGISRFSNAGVGFDAPILRKLTPCRRYARFLGRRPGAGLLRISDAVQEKLVHRDARSDNFDRNRKGSRFAALLVFREGRRIMETAGSDRRAAQGDFASEEMTLSMLCMSNSSSVRSEYAVSERERSKIRIKFGCKRGERSSDFTSRRAICAGLQ